MAIESIAEQDAKLEVVLTPVEQQLVDNLAAEVRRSRRMYTYTGQRGRPILKGALESARLIARARLFSAGVLPLLPEDTRNSQQCELSYCSLDKKG